MSFSLGGMDVRRSPVACTPLKAERRPLGRPAREADHSQVLAALPRGRTNALPAKLANGYLVRPTRGEVSRFSALTPHGPSSVAGLSAQHLRAQTRVIQHIRVGDRQGCWARFIEILRAIFCCKCRRR